MSDKNIRSKNNLAAQNIIRLLKLFIEKDSLSISDIEKELGFKTRQTIYSYINSLQHMGCVFSKNIHNRHTYYSLEHKDSKEVQLLLYEPLTLKTLRKYSILKKLQNKPVSEKNSLQTTNPDIKKSQFYELFNELLAEKEIYKSDNWKDFLKQNDFEYMEEAMLQAIGFMKGDSVNTIELVSMESLMKEHENPEWKKKVSMQDLVLPGSVEILEAAKTDDARLLRETDNKLFLRMFLKYLQKNHHKIYLLAASQEELVKAEEALARYNQGIRVVGDAVIHLEDGELTDADRIHGIVNAVNGSEADCILSVLPSPAQEDFIEQYRALIDTRVWIGCGSVLMRSFDDRKMTSRIKRMLVKKVFRYKVEKQN